MASLGAKLVLGARHEEALIQIAEEVRAVGAEAAYCVTDVSRRKDLLNLVHVAVETFGQLDVLFSNAGAMPIGTFDELAVDDWEAMVDVNIKGVLFGIAAALPVFRKQRPGTSSILHRRLLARQYQIRGVYSATKAAVLALSDGLRQEGAGQIRVSTILPGFTDTAFSEHVKSPELKANMQNAGAKFGMSPRAVARAVVYILQQPEEVNIGEVILRSRAQA